MSEKDEEIAIYEWLLSLSPMVPEPAVVRMGARCVIGRWVSLAEIRQTHEKLILQSPRMGVEVLGWGATWEEAHQSACEGLTRGLRFSTSPVSLAPLANGSPPGFACAETTPRVPS
jgi:hypothetical protein